MEKREEYSNSNFDYANDYSGTSSHVSACVPIDDNGPVAVRALVSFVSTSKSLCLHTCQGIVPRFRDTEFQLNLAASSLNGVLGGDSSFMISSFDQWHVVHAAAYKGGNGSICKDKAYQCDSCFAICSDSTRLQKIRDKIQKRAISC